MLKKLELSRVGPAPHLGHIELGERLNLLTGDNGLGKSFLLDVTWWALTGTWPDRPAWPREDSTREAPAEIRAIATANTTDSVIEPADDPTRPEALHLDPDEVYNSLQSDDGKTICLGLIEDWVTWPPPG